LPSFNTPLCLNYAAKRSKIQTHIRPTSCCETQHKKLRFLLRLKTLMLGFMLHFFNFQKCSKTQQKTQQKPQHRCFGPCGVGGMQHAKKEKVTTPHGLKRNITSSHVAMGVALGVALGVAKRNIQNCERNPQGYTGGYVTQHNAT